MGAMRWSMAAVILIAGLSAIPVSAGSDEPAAVTPDTIESALFVGNSLTFFSGGVDQHFAGLVGAETDPPPIEVHSSTRGGATLPNHLLLGLLDEIDGGDYSVVVLQGAVHNSGVDAFSDATRTLDAAIRESGGRTVLYMTWHMEPYDSISLEEVASAHRKVGEELDVLVAPVGLAMADALEERPDLAMLKLDRIHPTVHGSYLAAAVIYATIIDRSPEGLAYAPADVSTEEAAFLQRIAWEAVGSWRADGSPAAT